MRIKTNISHRPLKGILSQEERAEKLSYKMVFCVGNRKVSSFLKSESWTNVGKSESSSNW